MNPTLTTNRALALLAASIAIIAAGYLYQNIERATVAGNIATTTTETADVENNTVGSVTSPTASQSMIAANSKDAITAPDATKPLVFKNKLTTAEKASIQKQFVMYQAAVQKDPMAFNEWLSIGTANVLAGDYARALEILNYVSAKWPGNPTSFANLGDLYMNYLRDYPKAEKNWLIAIQNKPDDVNPYRSLFTLYTETSYKPTNTAAEDVMKKATAQFPNAYDLQVLMARYYAKIGEHQKATTQFESAAKAADAADNTAMAAQIRAEAATH